MAADKMNAVLRLRHDSLTNYERVGTTFVPKDGEICLVNTTNGIKAKIGNGYSPFDGLGWADLGIISTGYFNSVDNMFYKDSAFTTLMDTFSVIYMDLGHFELYYYNGRDYSRVNSVGQATSEKAGILKLYDTWDGYATDGTVTQNAIRSKFTEIQNKLDAMKIKLTTNPSGDFIAEFAGFNVEM